MNACDLNKLSRYHDGELSPAQASALEQHLAGCAACATELAGMRALSRALRSGSRPRASTLFVHRIDALSRQVEDSRAVRFVMRLTGAAAAVLIGGICFLNLQQSPRPANDAVMLGHDELMVVDPDSAAATVADDSVASAEPRLANYIVQNLSGGRP